LAQGIFQKGAFYETRRIIFRGHSLNSFHSPMMNASQPRAYLSHAEAAEFLRISPALLAKMVRLADGPRRRRIGRRVLYMLEDLRIWMETRLEPAVK
jgi:predicted DNA-binding transcriptional regulator AlpA